MSDPRVAPPAPAPSAIAIVALVVGIVSLLLSIIPWVGIGMGVVGVIIGIIALLTKSRTAMSVVGLVLSILAVLVGIIVLLFVYLLLPVISTGIARGGYDDGAGENSRYDENYDYSKDYLVSTPCYSFTGPKATINHQEPYKTDDCVTNLEGHGGLDGTDRYVFDRSSYGYVAVGPTYDKTSAPGGSADVDGSHATVVSSIEGDWTTDTISVTTPTTMKNYYGEFTVLTITIHAPTAQADDVLQQLVDSWKWK